MSQLMDIFSFVADCIVEYVQMMNSNWLTQIIMYTVVVGFVVSTILIIRR